MCSEPTERRLSGAKEARWAEQGWNWSGEGGRRKRPECHSCRISGFFSMGSRVGRSRAVVRLVYIISSDDGVEPCLYLVINGALSRCLVACVSVSNSPSLHCDLQDSSRSTASMRVSPSQPRHAIMHMRNACSAGHAMHTGPLPEPLLVETNKTPVPDGNSAPVATDKS